MGRVTRCATVARVSGCAIGISFRQMRLGFLRFKVWGRVLVVVRLERVRVLALDLGLVNWVWG